MNEASAARKRTALAPGSGLATTRMNAGKTPRAVFARASADARWPLVVEVLVVLVPLAFIVAGLRAP